MNINLNFPVEDEGVISVVRETVQGLASQHKRVRIAMFDTVATFPGVRLPWEGLTALCKELGVLSLIDGAMALAILT